MKRLAIAFLVLAFAVGTVPAFAQTSTTAVSSQIQTLLDQIKNLQVQIQALKTAQTQVQSTLSLIKELSQGISGEDVATLQAILASDPDVYPEGLITGYFGALTSNAVKRFQKKHGIEQVGRVGPKTLKKLNEQIALFGLAREDGKKDDLSEERALIKELCVRVPPGHLIAPGWLRKNNNDRPLVPICQNLPPGIIKKLPGATTTPPATTTPDTTAPVISGVSVGDVSQAGAKIMWSTNESSNSKIWYSTSSPVSTSSAPQASSNSKVTTHNMNLTGLLSGTTYYFVVASADASGNTGYSTQGTFGTSAATDTTAPVISGVSVSGITGSSVNVNWSTDESASSKVWYSTSTPVVIGSGTQTVSSATLVTSHSLGLSGLSTSTVYHYIVVSADAGGNAATSSQNSFTTNP